jgi:uncharacterized protein
MLRTSSYTIYVALPESTDEMLLVHGYSGAYDRVSRSVAEYLMSREPGPPPVPLYGEWSAEPALQRAEAGQQPSDSTLDVLTKRGYLTEMSVPEEEGHVARIIKKRHMRASQQQVNYIFMPTYNCNLRCAYCFQAHMRTQQEFRHLLRTMTREMADRIFAALPAIERQHGIEDDERTRTVGLFGGEPLLKRSRGIVEYIMDKAREMGPTQFWAVSNATELQAYEDLIGPDGISTIQITLDGPPDEHDKRRIHADGAGSYAEIAPNIDLCLARGARVAIRVNVDPANLADVPRLAEEIVARGWDKQRGFSVYTSPIVPNEHVGIEATFSTWHLDQAIDELRELHPSMRVVGRPDDGMQSLARTLIDRRAGLPSMKTSFCSAHTGMYIFDAFGDIYACWERTGDERVRIGRVLDGGEVEMNGWAKVWHSRTPASNPTCRKCRYAFQCGGGCAVLAEGQKGKFFTNYCDGFADRFRHSVAMAYMDHQAGVEVEEAVRVCDL